MEEDLDQIASGERTSFDFVRDFYRGTNGPAGPRAAGAVRRTDAVSRRRARHRRRLGTADPRPHRPVRPVRASAARAATGNTASLPEDVAPADSPSTQAVELLKAKAEGPRALGVDPATGRTVYVMNGRFGPYVQLGEMPEKDDAKGAKAGTKPKRAVAAEARVARPTNRR